MAAQGAKRPLGAAGAPPTSQRTSAPLTGSAGRVKPGVRYRRAAQGKADGAEGGLIWAAR